MLNIGCHLSTTKGFKNMGKEALSIGANTFQFFTRNPRGGKAKDIDEFEEKIRKILNHELPSLTKNAYKVAKERDLRIIGRKLHEIYDELLKK